MSTYSLETQENLLTGGVRRVIPSTHGCSKENRRCSNERCDTVTGSDDAAGLHTARQLVRAEAAALAALESQLDARLDTAAQLILGQPGKVLTVGVGTSSHVARRLAHLLSVTGTPALFMH